MATAKQLKARDYSVTSFVVHQTQSYSYISGSSMNPDQVVVDLAETTPTDFLLTLATGSIIPGFINDNGRNAYTLYRSLIQSFYAPSASITEMTGFYPDSSCFVVSVGSNAFGEGIKPGTFSVEVVGSGTLTDDGAGALYISGTQIGNVFYDAGVAVILRDEGAGSDSLTTDGMALFAVGEVAVSFNSTLTIYEHTVVCRMQPEEFNWTWNPSLLSGSNDQGDSVYSQFASGSLNPYMTTIGLYNELGELMAVGKMSQPIPRAQSSQQTLIVKFDT
jgi:hypothetical protein